MVRKRTTKSIFDARFFFFLLCASSLSDGSCDLGGVVTDQNCVSLCGDHYLVLRVPMHGELGTGSIYYYDEY